MVIDSVPILQSKALADVSVVTPCKNCSEYIEQCLSSVHHQHIKPREHIVIDGASVDGTVNILTKSYNSGGLTFFVSEPDSGISYAFNKGITLSSSKYVCFLNSDDRLTPDHFLFANEGMLRDYDIIISDISFERNPPRRLFPQYPDFSSKVIWKPPQINHPGMIIKKSLFESLGVYDLNYEVAMDVDLFYRALCANASVWKTSKVTVHQSSKGKSQSEWKKALHELYLIETKFGRVPYLAKIALGLRMIKGQVRRSIGFFKK